MTGRPNKGDRHVMVTRAAKPVAEIVMDEAKQHGVSISEYIAAVLAEHVGRSDLATLPTAKTRAELPLTG